MTSTLLTQAAHLCAQIAVLPHDTCDQQREVEVLAAAILDMLVDATQHTDAAIEIEEAAANIRKTHAQADADALDGRAGDERRQREIGYVSEAA